MFHTLISLQAKIHPNYVADVDLLMLQNCQMLRDHTESPETHLIILREVTVALSESVDLESTLSAIARLLRKYVGMKRGSVSLVSPISGEIVTQIYEGASKQQPGEKIINMVVNSGRPVAIASVGREPLFVDRGVSRRATINKEDFAFLCVPIRYKNKVIGALSVDSPTKRTSFERELRLLEIISSIIAHAVHAHRNIEQEKAKLLSENMQMKAEMRERFHVHNIIGNDKRMLEIYEQIHQVASSDSSVLLRGESGTGKELIANAIHYQSDRSSGPLVKLNCGALPEADVENELFGCERGAFPGALEAKPGRFERADGGTLYLDEIGELSTVAQTKLLRVIQEREVERVGGKKSIRVNVRIIAATNRDLSELVKEGRFRRELFYRLNVFPIYLPALRERRSDISLLVDHFLQKFAKRDRKSIRRIATAAIDMLVAYHWPGNVRELENVIERAVLVAKGGVIQAHHLPPTLQTAEASATAFKGTLETAVSAYERDLVADALKSARGNVSKAARLLGSTHRIIAYKIEKYKLDPEAYSTRKLK